MENEGTGGRGRSRSELEFFLGGHDLEMLTIRDLLAEVVPGKCHDKRLRWSEAKASAYRKEIEAALKTGRTPVLVELENDLVLPPGHVVILDHHGPLAPHDRSTSLHQVFVLLALPPERWTRWFNLVAANDRGHVLGLVEAGATPSEIREVRDRDRRAQGITDEEERLGEAAVRDARVLANGRLTVVRLPHNRTATAADRLEPLLGGAGYENLLVLCPDEVNFFGCGPWIRRLDGAFPGGWFGGDLPERGFWGRRGLPGREVEATLTRWLAQQSA